MTYTLKQFKALFIFIIPSIIISAVLFILDPPSTTIIIGLCILLVFACVTYFLGIHGVMKEMGKA